MAPVAAVPPLIWVANTLSIAGTYSTSDAWRTRDPGSGVGIRPGVSSPTAGLFGGILLVFAGIAVALVMA